MKTAWLRVQAPPSQVGPGLRRILPAILLATSCVGTSGDGSAVAQPGAAVVASSGMSSAAASLPDGDPADFQAVQAVCTSCHSAGMYMSTPRSWVRWTDTFQTMTNHGAHGTDEQIERVIRFFLENLTIVNVNTSPANEIIPVLGVSDEVGAAIVSRRAQHKFTSVADLAAIPGVDRVTLQKRKDRILF